MINNMTNKLSRKLKRKKRVGAKMFGTAKRPRISVFRSNKYISTQAVNDEKQISVAGVTSKKLLLKETKGKTKLEIAFILGENLAKHLRKKKVSTVVFDRGAYKYHGRVKALAEGLRKGGLKF